MACKEEPRGSKPFLPGLVKLQVIYQTTLAQSSKAANILHCRWADNINHPQSDLNQVGANFATLWSGQMLPLMGTHWEITGVVASSLGGDGLVSTESITSAGTSGATSFPPQVAVCVSWKAPITQRGGRARTYLPGPPSNATLSIDSPVLNSTYAANLKAAALQVISNMNAFTVGGVACPLGVPSYYSKCQLRITPLFFAISSANVHDRLDSQRRRSGKEATFTLT